MSEVSDLSGLAKEQIVSLARGNNEFISNNSIPDHLTKGQQPSIILYMCSDSRIQMNHIAPLSKEGYDPLNRIFTIENAGNRIDHPSFSASGSYAGMHISSTSLLCILGHTGCGAVDAVSTMGEDSIKKELPDLAEYLLQMKTYLTGNFKGLSNFKGEDVFSDSISARSSLAELNVDFQVATALNIYRKLVDAGKLTVIGGMTDLHNLYGKQRGKIYITNFNGVTNVNSLEGLSLDENSKRLTGGIPPDKIKLMQYETKWQLM